MQTLLTQEDSKRVADAIIERINESNFDVYSAVHDAIRSVIKPVTSAMWKEDWFPWLLEETCNKISSGVIDAAYLAAKNIGEE